MCSASYEFGSCRERDFLCLFYQPSVFNICHSPVCALSVCLSKNEKKSMFLQGSILCLSSGWAGVRYDCSWLSCAYSLGIKSVLGYYFFPPWKLISLKEQFNQLGNVTRQHIPTVPVTTLAYYTWLKSRAAYSRGILLLFKSTEVILL